MRGLAKNAAPLLHKKECPYDYRCREVDCLDCAEAYAREMEASEEVDGLASEENDKVNTALRGEI